jgi:hypothetical protein
MVPNTGVRDTPWRAVVLGLGVLQLGLPSGCAFQQKKVEQELKGPQPVNCATAEGDLRVLQSEKANVAQRIVEGVTAIHPAAAVTGLVTGIEGTKFSVATGEYNKMIDARIAEIKRTCGIE